MMGCSASKPISHQIKNPEHYPPSSSSSPFSHSLHSSPAPAVSRTFSLQTPLIHHPPIKKGDTHHLVSLTSTTYGSLLLIDRPKPNSIRRNRHDKPLSQPPPAPETETLKPLESDHSLSPDSVINTWELMYGLEDDDEDEDEEFNSFPAKKHIPTKPISVVGNGFAGKSSPVTGTMKSSEPEEEIIDSIPPLSPKKPLWKHITEESFLAKLDPNVASSYNRALSSRQFSTKSVQFSPLSSSFSNNWSNLSATHERIVIYFTSLRGIRKTYEDCCWVRMIFRGFRVSVDEKDISMDSLYKKELKEKLDGKAMVLPQVFIKGKHIGGVEEIKQMNEMGELGKILEGFPVRDCLNSVCESCGDARFVPCSSCNGSRKMFDEEDGKLRRCLDCNENGLIRCSLCCCL